MSRNIKATQNFIKSKTFYIYLPLPTLWKSLGRLSISLVKQNRGEIFLVCSKLSITHIQKNSQLTAIFNETRVRDLKNLTECPAIVENEQDREGYAIPWGLSWRVTCDLKLGPAYTCQRFVCNIQNGGFSSTFFAMPFPFNCFYQCKFELMSVI